jgi:hypothetical protein
MTRSRIYKITLVAMAVLLFCASAQMQNWLNRQRGQLGLTRVTPLENAPPLLALTTVALGGFRGLIANALWMRANDLQNDDKYFEMVQLADWITALEPHFTEVWRVQSWNMAYNISVKFKDPEDRWHWVERGIELLRDHGIPLNPDAALLYRDLAWLFQHKMGQNLDDAHYTYKLRWAQEMQNVLGGHPNIEALEHPKTPEEKERARKLREVYKMDPVIIQKVDDEYGPLDWRLPDAHAVYWAEVYRQKANPDTTNLASLWPEARSYQTNGYETDMLRRNIFQSLRMACFRGGALSPSVTNVTEKNFMLWPNLDLVPKFNAAYVKMIEEQPDSNFQNAHKNFLKEAIPLLWANGRVKEAAYWFDYLKKTYTNAFVGRQANISMEDFVLGDVNETFNETDQNQVLAQIGNLFQEEFILLIKDNDAEAVNCELLAKKVWDFYHHKIGKLSDVRLALPPILEIKQRVLDNLLDPKANLLTPEQQDYLRTKVGLKKPAPGAPEPAAPPPASTAPS